MTRRYGALATVSGVFTGAGTVLNVATILVGSAIGVALGARLPERTRDVVTDGLGLVTMLVAALSAVAVLDVELTSRVGGGGGAVLVVLAAILLGSIVGSLLRIEHRLEAVGEWFRGRFLRNESDTDGRKRFVEGFVSASLVFCVGPLAILGALSDGLGQGIEQLALKSTLDGFASIAFAASLGIGVALSALAVGLYQGAFTLVGVGLGGVMPAFQVAAMTATGGLLLVGISLRLLRIRAIPVGDMLPALAFAPVIALIASRLVS
jgi:uncharacterized protein